MKKLQLLIGLLVCSLVLTLPTHADELLDAIKDGDKARVAALLAKGTQVNTKDRSECNIPLHTAVESGNREIAELLLAQGANVNARNCIGSTALHRATKRDVAELLLARGADVNAKDNGGETPLFSTARRKDMAEWLIAHKADVNAKNIIGDTLLYAALHRFYSREVVELFLAHGAVLGMSTASDTLHDFAIRGDTAKAATLLSKGGNVNTKDKAGWTPLHLAAAMGRQAIAELLLAHGAEVNAQDNYGIAAIYTVRTREVAALLVAHGADVNARTKGGYTPLHSAVDKEVTELLLERGAKANAQSDDGTTPLYLAKTNEQAELLIGRGADVNARKKDGSTLLHGASRQKLELAELLLARGAAVNVKDNYGDSPLHKAAFDNGKEMVELLVSKGGAVNARNNEEETPLLRAVIYGNKLTVEALLAAGADVNAKDKGGNPPFVKAVKENKKDIAKMLVARGADVNAIDDPGSDDKCPILYRIDDKDLLEAVLARGANVNARCNNGEISLHAAAQSGKKDIVVALLARGANVNARRDDGETPLYRAAYAGRREAAEVLINHGADLSIKDKDGKSPLYAAAWQDKNDVVRLLLAHGAGKGEDGDKSLYIALMYGHKGVVEVFLAQGIDVNAKNKSGSTLLHYASGPYGSAKDAAGVVELLIARGANVNARSNDGQTPLHRAASNERKELVEVLIARGADINAKDNSGRTPLHFSAFLGKKGPVEALLAAGARVTVKDEQGNTPLQKVDDIRDTKVKREIAALLQATFKPGGSPREQLMQMVERLTANPNDTDLRERIIKLAQEIKPPTAIPPEAERFEGRAQYLFKNAKSENDYVNSARDYLKAIEAAPWIPGYYYDLCTILEKANRPKEALVACKLYLASSSSGTEASEGRRRAAGLEVAQERFEELSRQRSEKQRRGREAGRTEEIYSHGAVVERLQENEGKSWNVSVQVVTMYAGSPRNIILVNYYTDRSAGKIVESYPAPHELDGREVGNSLQRFTIRVDKQGYITVAGKGDSIRTTLSELFRKRIESLKSAAVVSRDGRYFVARFQGGHYGETAGWVFYESDCEGTPKATDSRALPDDFMPFNKGSGDWDLNVIRNYRFSNDDPCRSSAVVLGGLITTEPLGWLSK